MRFSVVDEATIPASTNQGNERLSIRDLLHRSHEVRALAVEPRTVYAAVMRQLLLPIVIDAEGPPTSEVEWRARFLRGGFDRDQIDAYLDRYADRFDLFDDEKPFAQVGGLVTTTGEAKGAGLLLPALASGNNVPLFSAATEATPTCLPAADAMLWLLHAHCYDTAAIKSGAAGDPHVKAGKTTGNPVGSLGRLGVALPSGPNLYETLVLNTPVRPDGADPADAPWWRRPPRGPAWDERPASGLLDLLTWQSRRIRLFPTPGDESVESVVLCAGDRLSTVPEFEPHTLWNLETKPKAGQPPRRPRAHRSGRTAWRGLSALLALPGTSTSGEVATAGVISGIADHSAKGSLPAGYPLNIEIIGIEYGNQSAVVENVIHDAIPLPLVALADSDGRDAVERFAADAEELARAVDRLERGLKLAMGGDLVPWDKGQRASARLLAMLDMPVRRCLAGLQRSPGRFYDAVDAWCATARNAALDILEELIGSVSAIAFAGHSYDDAKGVANVSTAELRFRADLNRILGPKPPLESDPNHREEVSA
ncbi:MAG: type I-E CRISPR-associated protein Cse1/CasA [Acidimicrobiia bacterium]